MSELEEKHLEAQVEWGPENHEKINKTRISVAELQYQIYEYLEKQKYSSPVTWQREHNDVEEYKQHIRKTREILYNTDSKNEFTQQINEALNEFEKWLRPKVK